MNENIMEKITALCKRRGFIYSGSEIYGGIGGIWDYGPLGVELKNNIKREWWRDFVHQREDIVGIDSAIIMNPTVWEASGHVNSFTDPLVECKVCHKRFRADKKEDLALHEDEHSGKKEIWTEAKKFNLLVEAKLGVIDDQKQIIFLRGEITQGVHVNFNNIVNSSRVKIPFGIAQIGKAFRNEITPGNFTFRSREFEQFEIQFYIRPEDKEGERWMEYWKKQTMAWYVEMGINSQKLRFRQHASDEKAHYAKDAWDIEYEAPFGWSEFQGIHHRGDWDLKRHKEFSGKDLSYVDSQTNEKYLPWDIEVSGGVDRASLFFLIDAYMEEEKRIVLKLHPRIAPVKLAVFPLLANKTELIDLAKKIYCNLKKEVSGLVVFDDRGNIGKRYYAQDEIGTPYCLTVDFQSLTDKAVTVRERDTAKQERIPIEKLTEFFSNKF